MDTNIDNYNNNEIISLLKVRNDQSLTVDILADKIDRTIQKVKQADIDDNPELVKFFQDCFVRISLMKGFEITEIHRNTLALAPLPIVPDNIVVPGRDDNMKIVEPKIYAGNLTQPQPTAQSVSAYARPYARGTVNPVERETIKYLLTINSKFRPEYKPYNCNIEVEQQETFPSQGDLIRDKTFCRNSPAIVKRVVELEACSKSTNRGYKNTETDFIVELQESLSNVVSIKLAGLEMMNGYYSISEYLGTNVFRITTYQFDETMPPIDGGNIGNVSEHTISISQGSYSVVELMETINCVFLASSHIELNAVELKYDCISGKFHFVLRTEDENGDPIVPPAGMAFGFQLDFRHPLYPYRSLFYNLGWMMGYRESIYTMTGSYISCPSTTCLLGIGGEAPVNLIGTHYFLVEVDDFNNNNPVVLNYNCDTEFSFNIRNILGKVPNAAHTNEVLFEDSSDRIFKSRKYFGPVKINKLKIRILDENGRQINLNNSDFTINIEVETLNTPYKNMIR
uniref:Uncharacterized protein n=1 Tax=viral metagenome TaxID=1070528 RepID=A0A6C0LH81_9ZZZZ